LIEERKEDDATPGALIIWAGLNSYIYTKGIEMG
jgi:hypothetical protein